MFICHSCYLLVRVTWNPVTREAVSQRVILVFRVRYEGSVFLFYETLTPLLFTSWFCRNSFLRPISSKCNVLKSNCLLFCLLKLSAVFVLTLESGSTDTVGEAGQYFQTVWHYLFFQVWYFFPMKRKFQVVSFSMSTSIKEKFPILDLLILNKVFHVTWNPITG